jgi:archaellum component FlaD/FlaE
MTEFPWDIKKSSGGNISNAASSDPELPAFLTGNSGPGESIPPSVPSSIPDILASAFSGVPMEEARVEMPPFDSRSEGQPAPFTPPDFQNMNDISGMFLNNVPNSPAPSTEMKLPLSPHFSPGPNAPFLRAIDPDAPEKKPDMSLFQGDQDIVRPPSGAAKAPSTEASGASPSQKTGKKSPPPIFKLQLPDEDVPDNKPRDASDAGAAGLPPVFTLDPGPSKVLSDPSMASPSLHGNIPGNPFSPFSNSLPEYVAPSPDLFTGPVNPPGSFSLPQAAGSSSAFAQPSQQSPLSGPAAPMGNPFAGPQANPFADQVPSHHDPFAGQVQPPTNPFNRQILPSSGPFPDGAGQSSNPFVASVPAAGPFPGPFPVTHNLFAGGTPPAGNSFPDPGSLPGRPMYLQGSKSLLLKVGALRKNLDGATTAVRSLFKGAVMGKSLIERMEEIRNETDPKGMPDGISPFTSGTPADPFSMANACGAQAGPIKAAASTGSVNPFGREEPDLRQVLQEPGGDAGIRSIRRVTPIAEPLMELKDEHRIDLFAEEEDPAGYTPDAGNGILKTIPLEKPDIKPSGGRSLDDKGSSCSTFPEDVPVNEQIDGISSGLRDVKAEMENVLSRFADIGSNVLGLSATVEEMSSMVAGLRAEEQRLSDTAAHVGSLDKKVGSLDSRLGSMQSDNQDIRANLARMEEGLSELVNSYTALLVQMHESSQEAEARLSRLEGALEKLSPLEDRLHAVEKFRGESQSMSMELAKSISSLMDDMGATSASLQEFKEASGINNGKLKDDIRLMTEYVDSELQKIGARSFKGYGQNVHLSNIMKNSSNMKLCMEWLEFLMGLVGRNNLPDILSYYEELGWLTEQVRSELMHYAEGIDFYMEKPDWKLTPDDHVKSIWFIESLAGLKVDKNRLSVIDRDIEKVKKGTEIYGI